MKVADRVNVDGHTLASWYTLPEAIKNQILQRLVDLSGLPPDQWPTNEVRPYEHPEAFFLLLAPDGFRVALRREDDGELTVRHIFLQELIDRYFSTKPEPARTP